VEYNWTDYHVLTDASNYSPVPIRLILSCDLYLTRLAPSRLANFPRMNESHSSIYGDHVVIADAPLGAPYKDRVSVGLLLPCHGNNCFCFTRTFSFLLVIFRNRVQDPRKKAHRYCCDGPERYWVAEEDHA
jgi:hypothetical protein